ncbi:DUF1830 domain-containing protein [Lyngbya sp. CCY1209]|uniref:DUF1830 domain-containing protein n=1 Tax=Lyngbya sp. CCY1209 TaxID=2886103 RepID=UPI002D2128D9|nr:DUF1830 domain-containing protein [Lyngbya sp. CCY1209]MEB3882910.1 DUF1830 domain-containing protein [Lyngbya sp. CCY1209]
MTAILDKIQIDSQDKRLCCYFNSTKKVQVARISNIENWYLEHVVFPGERFLFEAPSSAELEIYQSGSGRAMLLQKLTCYDLVVDDGSDLKVAS